MKSTGPWLRKGIIIGDDISYPQLCRDYFQKTMSPQSSRIKPSHIDGTKCLGKKCLGPRQALIKHLGKPELLTACRLVQRVGENGAFVSFKAGLGEAEGLIIHWGTRWWAWYTLYIYTYVYNWKNIYIYICIYIHTYIYTYTYLHIYI